MPAKLALLIAIGFVYYSLRTERKRCFVGTQQLFWPTLWYMVVASRPIGVWMYIWGIPTPGGSDDPTEGSAIDRYFFISLTILGLGILARRRFSWGATLRRNSWLTAFVVFMAISVVWSQYPFVSFKRFTKVVGSIVMALVVLTSEQPLDSIFTVLRRVLYVHLPMSLLCTRYYRDVGVGFDWGGTTEVWNGISTSKNTLGQIAMLGVLYFFWEVRKHWGEFRWRNLHLVYLLMAVYLLKGGEAMSMTSVSVCVFALAIFLRIEAFGNRLGAIRIFVRLVFGVLAGLITFVAIHSVVMFSEDSIFGHVITLLGRDITLTDRTFIWHDVYSAASGNPILGVGFGGFWIGRIANIPWNETMSWVLGQAHSGYVDTYLQLGWVGVLLLGCVLNSSLSHLLDSLSVDLDLACFRITMLLTIMFVNITESTYLRGDHHLWLVMQLAIWSVPGSMAAESTEQPEHQEEPETWSAEPNATS